MENHFEILKFVRPGGMPYALVILVLAYIVGRVLSRFSDQLGERFADKRPIIHQAGSFMRFTVYLAGWAGAAAAVLELSNEMILAVGGAMAVAVGFAFKDLVASIVAGVIILIDRPFQVGDRVTADGHYGEVRSIGLRSVRLVTLDDTQITIPNNRFLTESVASGNAGQVQMMVQMRFWIGVDQNLATAKRIVEEALTSSRFIDVTLPWAVVICEVMCESFVAVQLTAKGYVLDVRFEKAFETDVTEQVLAAFDETAILAPAVLHRNV